MNKLVTVKVGTQPNDLAIARSYLEDNDIFCFILNENISQVYPLANYALGGAQLQVPEDEAKRAIALLIEGGFAKPEDYEI